MTRESPYKGRPGEEASGGKSRKEVYVYPPAKRCREVLRNGPPPARKRRRPPPAFAPEDGFVRLWGNVIGTVVRIANEHDRLWQQRRRVLNMLLVTLFVFRLVFSKDRQGYATTVAELWEQCRMMGIALPQATPVAASAMCRARAKLDEGVLLFFTLFRHVFPKISRTRFSQCSVTAGWWCRARGRVTAQGFAMVPGTSTIGIVRTAFYWRTAYWKDALPGEEA